MLLDAIIFQNSSHNQECVNLGLMCDVMVRLQNYSLIPLHWSLQTWLCSTHYNAPSSLNCADAISVMIMIQIGTERAAGNATLFASQMDEGAESK